MLALDRSAYNTCGCWVFQYGRMTVNVEFELETDQLQIYT